MSEWLDRRLAKWDAANQATKRKHNELAGGTWEEFGERHFPGPTWAYAITSLPVVGWIGVVVIARARRARKWGGPQQAREARSPEITGTTPPSGRRTG